MEVVIASNNAHKIVEIKALLAGVFNNIYSLAEKGVCVEVDETGTTFLQNAELKANAIMRITNLPALADDSGLIVDALGGAPGVYSARFSGKHATDSSNNALLLNRLQGVENRTARFACAMVLVYPDGTKIEAEGFSEGEILAKADGEGGFGYDPLFYSYDLKKSFGAATAEEKNSVSHRARALAELKKKLS